MPGAQSFIDIGFSRFDAGDIRGAELHFLEALKILPSSASGRVGIGLINAQKGSIDEALKNFYIAIKVEESNSALKSIIDRTLSLPQFAALLSDKGTLEDRIRIYLESANIVVSEIQDRTSLINYLVKTFNFKKYLEIGCHDDQNFHLIQCPFRVGVDPVQGGTQRLSSDEFFALTTETFDIVFVDGLHHADQVYRDVINALKHVRAGGLILLHDCMPMAEINQLREPADYVWNGDVWKAFVKLRCCPDLDMRVCAFDHGVGVIKQTANTAPIFLEKPFMELTWSDFIANKESWLRQGSAEEIEVWLKS